MVSGRLRATVESHLGSHDVARVLYGTIVGLALVLALEHEARGAGATAGFIVAAALVVGLAELFSEAISMEARKHAPVTRTEMRVLGRDALAVVVGAGFPAIYFVLAGLGAFTEQSAFRLAKWSGVILVCTYAFLAARMAGIAPRRAAWHAGLAGLAGVALVQVKSVVLH
jgi:hypothetical protein